MMSKAWSDFLFGLFLGLGLICSYGLLKLLLWLIGMLASGAQHMPSIP